MAGLRVAGLSGNFPTTQYGKPRSALSPDLCLVGHYHRHAGATRDGTHVVSLAPAWERYDALDAASLEPTARPTSLRGD